MGACTRSVHGTEKRTRTSMGLRPLAPEASVSTIPPPRHGRCELYSALLCLSMLRKNTFRVKTFESFSVAPFTLSVKPV